MVRSQSRVWTAEATTRDRIARNSGVGRGGQAGRPVRSAAAPADARDQEQCGLPGRGPTAVQPGQPIEERGHQDDGKRDHARLRGRHDSGRGPADRGRISSPDTGRSGN